eukprot:scaffold7485_cov127-Isochrysis_galbana.AAC.1
MATMGGFDRETIEELVLPYLLLFDTGARATRSRTGSICKGMRCAGAPRRASRACLPPGPAAAAAAGVSSTRHGIQPKHTYCFGGDLIRQITAQRDFAVIPSGRASMATPSSSEIVSSRSSPVASSA